MKHQEIFLSKHPLPWTLAIEPRSEAEILDDAREGLDESRRMDEAVLSDPDISESDKKRYISRTNLAPEDEEMFWVDMTDHKCVVLRDANGKTITRGGEADITEVLARAAVFYSWKPEWDDDGWDMVRFWAIDTIASVCSALSLEAMYLPDFLRNQLVFDKLKRCTSAFASALLKRKPLNQEDN